MTNTHVSGSIGSQSIRGPETLLGFRPVSGLRTGDGHVVADGRLFRSATPQFTSAAEAATLVADTGLAQVIDLRLDTESRIEGSGGLEGTGVSMTNIPLAIREPVAAGSSVAPMTATDPLVGTYLEYLGARQALPAIVDTLLAGGVDQARGGLPALIHCTVGKDRTGVVVGLLLDAIGVLRHDIGVDYVARSEDVPAMMGRLVEMKTFGDAVKVYPPQAYQADPATMLRFLAWMDIEHGGARKWLGSVGVTDVQVTQLAERLLLPDNGPQVTQILRSAVLPATADEVWALVGDTAGVHRWVPGLADTTVDGDVRTATFDDGGKAHELIVAHDNDGRSYTYRYLDGPIPLDAYESTVTVGPELDGDGSLVVWNATLQASPEIVSAVEGLYDAGIGRLRELF